MPTQADLYADLKEAVLPDAKRDIALDLLDVTSSRQYLDDCLRILNSEPVIITLEDKHRSILRDKYLLYHDDTKRDKGGMLRESITRLLVHIEHPKDIDIYKLGVETYYLQPVDDVAQNLRAVALAGLAPIDLPLASLYATKFLGEEFTSVFNCEPAMTAVDVLVQANQRLPIYQFLLTRGEHMANTKRGELTGKALESLDTEFPQSLFEELIDTYQALDQPTASIGIINTIIDNRLFNLYDRLEEVVLATRDDDLRRYGLVMMSASRDDDLAGRLLQMARLAKYEQIPLFVEAVEVCNHTDRDRTLNQLRDRL